MTMIFPVFLYLVIGAIAGVFGGLLGIGGGSLTVPALLLVFSFLGFPEDHVMHIAIGTSLAAMVINTLSAAYFHHKKKGVVWEAVKRVFIGIVVGSFIGAFIARELSSDSLKALFGAFACLIGLVFIRSVSPLSDTHKMPSLFVFSLIGIGVAALANLLGVGGGLFMVPILLYFKFNEKKAIGTSSATSCLISLGGAIGYLMAAEREIPIAGCFGYIYVPAFLAISIGSLGASFYGVKLAHILPASLLRKIFAVTMIAIGLSMILT